MPHSHRLGTSASGGFSQLEQSGSDGGVPEVMIRARALHTQRILKILNWWVRPKALVKHTLRPASPSCENLLDIDPFSELGSFL